LFCTCLTYARSYEIQFFTTKIHKRLDYTQLKNIGITKVLFRVFKDDEEDGGLYFVNSEFRTLNPGLEQLIEEFDFHHLKLCAWMIGRKFSWITDSTLLDYQYENGSRQQVRKIDIFNPQAVKKIITVFKELASHKLDCILIQDDFTLRYNEGFSNWGKASFTGATGVPAHEKLMMQKNTPYNVNWKRVKIDRLNHVLSQIVKNCKMVNSGIKIGINIYYEAPIFPERAKTWYSHYLPDILESGVDYIYLMSYHRQIKEEMNLNETRNRQFFRDVVKKAYELCKEKLIVKLQLRDWTTGKRISIEEARIYFNLIPPQVERVCFTPVTLEDFDYLAEIIKKP